ncbi:hypothetical protein [Granulicella mallensis]|uniref:Uncharacterized protein n=1 Tax=Granulicella mallensis TaxID=940614 RepID=A0A7W7ZU60_9BACT|nr:hypothetical protein [Granulicella mallensis]MBB5066160.1 hypothetical protein [Granulicella mallensis]
MITIYNNTGTKGGGVSNPPIYYDVQVNFWSIDQMLDTGEWTTALPQTPLTVQRSSDNGYILLVRESLSPETVFAYYIRKDDNLTISKMQDDPYVQSDDYTLPNLKYFNWNNPAVA